MHETPSDLVWRPVITWRPARNEHIASRALNKSSRVSHCLSGDWDPRYLLCKMATTTTNWETVRHEGEVYKVLNDHAGTLTVTGWREQLKEYAEHICDKTGLELLKGIAPPCTPGHKIDKAALVESCTCHVSLCIHDTCMHGR